MEGCRRAGLAGGRSGVTVGPGRAARGGARRRTPRPTAHGWCGTERRGQGRPGRSSRGRGGQAVAQRGHEQLGRRTVARGQHHGSRARADAWSAPGEDLAPARRRAWSRLYGQTRPMRIGGTLLRDAGPSAAGPEPSAAGRSRRRRPAPRRRSASWAGAGATARGDPDQVLHREREVLVTRATSSRSRPRRSVSSRAPTTPWQRRPRK